MKTISLILGIGLFVMSGSQVFAQSVSTKKSDKSSLIPVTKTIANKNGLKHVTGVYVVQTAATSNNGQIALRSGDIILSVNNRSTRRPAEVIAARNSKEFGEYVMYKIWRNRKIHSLNLKKPSLMNIEKSDQFDVIYDEVPVFAGSIRCIVTKPKGIQRAPAILLVQNGNSGSVCDVPVDNIYRKLTDQLTQKGYVCMRIERVGVGEYLNQVNNNRADIYVEALGFEMALKKLKTYDFVDTTQTFLFGHCTGGKISPLIAARNSVKGVIVYGTCAQPPSEYLKKMVWNKMLFSGYDQAKTTREMKKCQMVLNGIIVKKMRPTLFAETNPNLTPIMRSMFEWKGDDNFLGRNASFIQSIEKMDSWKDLKNMKSKLLAIHGEADTEIPDGSLVKEMVDRCNNNRDGQATLVELPNTDHYFAKVGSLKKSFELQNSPDYSAFVHMGFNDELIDTVDAWIKQLGS